MRKFFMACAAGFLLLVAPTVYSYDQPDKPPSIEDCNRPFYQGYYYQGKFFLDLLENSLEKKTTQRQLYAELRRIDATVKRGWAMADVDEATRKHEIARQGTLEIVACLTKHLQPSDKVSYFDECRRPIKSMTPGGCTRGLIIRRDGKLIFKFITYRMTYE